MTTLRGIMKGFKNFIMRGSLIDTAVAFIMGAAFGTVVTTFTQIVLDLLGKLGGTPNFSAWVPGGVHVGTFLTALISFLILATVVYFAIVVPINKMHEITGLTSPDDDAETQSEAEILAEIRDLLVKANAQADAQENEQPFEELAASNSPSLARPGTPRRSAD